MDANISVVINTLNEEANIGDCIRSIQGLADEVVVCDMHSTDRTVEIARSMEARVESVQADLCDFGRLRHFAISQARCPWVMVIDADERMTPILEKELKRIANEDRVDVVYFSNLYWYFGGWVRHGGFFNSHWPRFFRRDAYLSRYRDSDEKIHSDLSTLWKIENRIVLPQSCYLEHYAYPTIEKYVSKTLGMYARLEAEQRVRRGERFAAWRMLAEPAREILLRFFWLQGFRDGWRGFILTVLYAAFRFVAWANVWFLTRAQCGETTSEPRPAA